MLFSCRWFNSVSSTACFRHLIPPLFAHKCSADDTIVGCYSTEEFIRRALWVCVCVWVNENEHNESHNVLSATQATAHRVKRCLAASNILPCAAVWSVECCAQAKTIRSEEGMEKTKICSQTVNVVIISSVQVFAAFRWTFAAGLRFVSRPYVFRASRVIRYCINVRKFIFVRFNLCVVFLRFHNLRSDIA